MPTALTMLLAYESQVAGARGSGMAGLTEQARIRPTIRALLDVVRADLDPRAASDR